MRNYLETEHEIFTKKRTCDILYKQNMRYFLETERKMFPRNRT